MNGKDDFVYKQEKNSPNATITECSPICLLLKKVNDMKVPYVIKERRPGDIATCYCNPAKAKAELGWEAKFGIEEMCRDNWRFQKNNPKGYEK